MLTSSATRNTIYRSFAAQQNNIGELSAKGEAQIAVADLVGTACGITLSRAVGTSRNSILMSYLVLTSLDISAIYREIRSVIFKQLNFERAVIVLRHYITTEGAEVLPPTEVAGIERIFRGPKVATRSVFKLLSDIAVPDHVAPSDLQRILEVFQDEKFAVLVPGKGPPALAVNKEVWRGPARASA